MSRPLYRGFSGIGGKAAAAGDEDRYDPKEQPGENGIGACAAASRGRKRHLAVTAAGAARHGPARHRRARRRRGPLAGGGRVRARVRELRALLLQRVGRRRCDGSGRRRRHKLRAAVRARGQGSVPRRAAADIPDSRAVAELQGLHLEGQRAD